MSEFDTVILNRNSTRIGFDEKMANNGGKGFLLTTNFYKSANNNVILARKNRKPEWKASIQTDRASSNNQEETTAKQLVMWKIQANKIHAKLVHPREEKMHATTNNLHYRFKGFLKFFKD